MIDTATFEFISEPLQIEELVSVLRTQKYIAFDTEFIRESTFFPVFELLQIATRESAWVVDIQAFRKRQVGSVCTELLPLFEVLTDPKIIKIVHAAYGDQECLYSAFQILATPLFDTSIAASLCGYGDQIGLAQLMQQVLGIQIDKGNSRTNWSVRPLPRPLIEYAINDVKCLVDLGLKILSNLQSLGRVQWAFDLSEQLAARALFDISPEEIAQKLAHTKRFDKKDYPVLLELVAWRERRVRHLNVPKRWVADDGVLLDLARAKPRSLEHLQAFRGLSKGELKGTAAEAILSAVNKGIDSTEEFSPLVLPRRVMTEDEFLKIELLKVLLNELAVEIRLSSRHILLQDKYLELIRRSFQSVPEVREEKIFSESLPDHVVEEIVLFLKGQLALSIGEQGIRRTRIDLSSQIGELKINE